MEPSPKTYGITSPISLAEPRPEDWQQTEELIDALKPHGVFENEDELNHRSVFIPYNVPLLQVIVGRICKTHPRKFGI